MAERELAIGNDLQFQGVYTSADLEAMARFAMAQSMDARLARSTLGALSLVEIAALCLRSWGLAMGGLIAVLGLSWLVRNYGLKRRLMQHGRVNLQAGATRSIRISAGEIGHSLDGETQIFVRKALERAVLTDSHLFLVFKPSGTLMLPLAWIHEPTSVEDVAVLLAQGKS